MSAQMVSPGCAGWELKRPEGEIYLPILQMFQKSLLMLLLLVVTLLVTNFSFSSASLRSKSSNCIMFSETLARIKSFPDPQRADRAMHKLMCTNIKLSRRVLTKNVLRRLMHLNVGTNEVEGYVAGLCKQNVRKERNHTLIRDCMRMKVHDSEYDERNIRKEL